MARHAHSAAGNAPPGHPGHLRRRSLLRLPAVAPAQRAHWKRAGAGAIAEGKIRNRHPQLQVRALSWWDVSERVAAVLYQDAIEGTLRSFHANCGETSVYLHHSPELVDMGKAVNEPDNYQRPRFSYHSRKLTESGVLGRPVGATADQGRQIVDMVVADLVEFVRACAAEEPPHDVWGITAGG